LGELIAEQRWKASSRFQQLAGEPLFLGQIAAALLLRGNDYTSKLIHPSTLARVSADVDRERHARTWLRGAREKAQRQVQFRKIRGQVVQQGDSVDDTALETVSTITTKTEPRVVLRPLQDDKWEILIELPDFSLAPSRLSQFTEVIANNRCHVTGSSGRPLARGRLLYGPQKVILHTWPPTDKPLLAFENAPIEFNDLLAEECQLNPGPTWLFKVMSDGLAYEIKSSTVRAGQRYIILCEESADLPEHPDLKQVTVNCKDIKAVELQLDDTISPDLASVLRTTRIQQALMTYVWPTGLPPLRWDGEGVGEWLSTDMPRLGIRADHNVKAFTLDLGFERIVVSPSAPGASVFIELPELEPGVYTAIINSEHEDDTNQESRRLQLRIRKPRTWSPGLSSDGAILVILEPTNPTLEDLWENKTEFHIHGPAGRKVICEIALFREGDTLPFLPKKLPNLVLPIDTAIWRRHMDQHFKTHKDVLNAYDLAQSCLVRLSAGELGTYTLVAEREFYPLRWAIRRTHDGFYLRILDDSGRDQIPKVARYDFEAPDIEQQLDILTFTSGEDELASPGLYVVRKGDYVRTVVIAPEKLPLQEMQFEVCISNRRRVVTQIEELIQIMDLWATARVTGSILSFRKRRDVLSTLVKEIFCLICGDRWARGETSLPESDDKSVLQCVMPFLKEEEVVLARKIEERTTDLASVSTSTRARRLTTWFLRHLRYHTPNHIASRECNDSYKNLLWLSELALRLASGSACIVSWTEGKLHHGISCLVESPNIARAARFMVLSIYHATEQSDLGSNLYEGWAWS